MKKYSQNNEQSFVLDKFKHHKGGKFMDIGAFDAFIFSNTRCLYELGFEGVLVEPSKPRLDIIKEQYKEDNRIKICEYAISSSEGVVDFYYTEDAISTIEEKHLKKWFNHKFEKTTIKTITPIQLFDQYGYDFDFISLDVESNNLDVMNHMPFDKLTNLKMLVVEHDNFINEMNTIMLKYGFKQIHKNGENLIFEK